MPSHTAYLALGSNLGDRSANLAAALAALAAHPHITVRRVAPVIETDPVDAPDGSPPFLNSAAEIETDLEPLDLLDLLQEIETRLGRVRSVRNAPRTLDLDLLLYADRVVRHDRLIVPHPRLHERAFVLAPLARIAPDVVHPSLDVSIATLLSRVRPRGA